MNEIADRINQIIISIFIVLMILFRNQSLNFIMGNTGIYGVGAIDSQRNFNDEWKIVGLVSNILAILIFGILVWKTSKYSFRFWVFSGCFSVIALFYIIFKCNWIWSISAAILFYGFLSMIWGFYQNRRHWIMMFVTVLLTSFLFFVFEKVFHDYVLVFVIVSMVLFLTLRYYVYVNDCEETKE